MNTIHQISLKLQLGIDPASNIQSEQLLQKWQEFRAQNCRLRAGHRIQFEHSSNAPGLKTSGRAA